MVSYLRSALLQGRCVALACIASAGLSAQTMPVRDSAARRAPRDSSALTRFSRVSGSELDAAPAFTLEQALQGKLPGVIVNMNDGAPWSDGQIQIRGISTIAGDPSPLVIVDGAIAGNTFLVDPHGLSGGVDDGMPVVSSARLLDLAPFEIESVEVLRGPMAAAMYGVRGANGVLVIRTRRGGSQPLRWRAMQRSGSASAIGLAAPRCIGSAATARADFARFASGVDAVIAASGGGALPCHAFEREYFGKTGVGLQTGLELAGSVGESRIALTASRRSNGGSVEGTGMSRHNLRLNLDRDLSSRLSVHTSAGLALSRTDRAAGAATARDYFSTVPSLFDLSGGTPPDRNAAAINPFVPLRDASDLGDDRRLTAAATVDYRLIARDDREFSVQVVSGIDRLRLHDSTQSEFLGQFEGRISTTTLLDGRVRNHAIRTHFDQRLRGRSRVTLDAALTFDAQALQSEFVTRTAALGVTRETITLRNTTRGAAVRGGLAGLGGRLDVDGGLRIESVSQVSPEFIPDITPMAYPAMAVRYKVWSDSAGATLHAFAEAGGSGGMGSLGVAPLNVGFRFPQLVGGIEPAFTTERRTEAVIGADLIAAHGRVSATVSVFNVWLTSLYAGDPDFDISSPGTVFRPDAARATGRGLEAGLRIRFVDRAALRWDAQANVSRSRTTVTGMRSKGWAPGAQIPYFRRQILLTGESATVIAREDSTVLGDGAASFDVTLANRWALRRISLSVQFDARSGGDTYSSASARRYASRTAADYDATTVAGTAFTGAQLSQIANAGVPSGAFITSGSFLRLREVVLRYALSPRWAQRAFATPNVGLSLQARNLALWTHSLAVDPELSGLGTSATARFVDNWRYPSMRQIAVGFDIGM